MGALTESKPKKESIYLDNHATTPMDPRVLDAMLPYLTSDFGNAASRTHEYGRRAKEAVTRAREQVADLIEASPEEVVFTSGATESDNLAIKGVVAAHKDKGNHVITTQIEHKAVLDTCYHLENELQKATKALTALFQYRNELSLSDQTSSGNHFSVISDPNIHHILAEAGAGMNVTYVGVSSDGLVDPKDIAQSINDRTILVSVMLANNEIGTIQPIKEIGKICRSKGIIFHSDAVQGVGKIPVNVRDMQVDLLSISGHKMYGPKGVGALYVRKKPQVRIDPLFHGGGHERGIRSGTLNVPAIVGFGTACELALHEMANESKRIASLRDKLWNGLSAKLDGLICNGSREHRLSGNLHVTFMNVEAEALMVTTRKLAFSTGSACTSTAMEPSHVLRACGIPDDMIHRSVRFGIGRFNTDAEIDVAVRELVSAVRKLRALRAGA